MCVCGGGGGGITLKLFKEFVVTSYNDKGY